METESGVCCGGRLCHPRVIIESSSELPSAHTACGLVSRWKFWRKRRSFTRIISAGSNAAKSIFPCPQSCGLRNRSVFASPNFLQNCECFARMPLRRLRARSRCFPAIPPVRQMLDEPVIPHLVKLVHIRPAARDGSKPRESSVSPAKQPALYRHKAAKTSENVARDEVEKSEF